MRQGTVEKGYDSNRISDEMLEGFEKQKHRLRAWAKAVAKLHGLEIWNFTSSFADGAIFHKIVDEYTFHIPSIQSSSHEPIEKENQLEKKVRQLGCNTYFGRWLTAFRRTSYDANLFQQLFLGGMKQSICLIATSLLPHWRSCVRDSSQHPGTVARRR